MDVEVLILIFCLLNLSVISECFIVLVYWVLVWRFKDWFCLFKCCGFIFMILIEFLFLVFVKKCWIWFLIVIWGWLKYICVFGSWLLNLIIFGFKERLVFLRMVIFWLLFFGFLFLVFVLSFFWGVFFVGGFFVSLVLEFGLIF